MIYQPRRGSTQARVLREWLGCDQPLQMDENVHLPADFVSSILRAAGMEEGLHEEQVKEAWRELAGEFIARNCQPESLKNGNLVLRVVQPTMRFHLEQTKPMLLQRVQGKLGADKVRSIRFVIG